MKIKIPIPGVILIQEESQFEISYAFMRLQEFYEHRDESRQGNFYTLDEVIENYRESGHSGKFSYLEDWGGFNVPSTAVLSFIEMYKHDFTAREKILFDTLQKVLDQEENAKIDDKFYLIGSCSDLYNDHEICHAIFYLYSDYRRDAEKLLKTLNKAEVSAVTKMLKDAGYSDSVISDEINSYLSSSDMYYIKETVFEHLELKGNQKWSWDKIYKFVENYWTWKEELSIEEDEQEIKINE